MFRGGLSQKIGNAQLRVIGFCIYLNYNFHIPFSFVCNPLPAVCLILCFFQNADPSAAGALKKEMRAAQAGLLAALSLPNSVHSVGSTEKRMLKPTS